MDPREPVSAASSRRLFLQASERLLRTKLRDIRGQLAAIQQELASL